MFGEKTACYALIWEILKDTLPLENSVNTKFNKDASIMIAHFVRQV